MAERELTQLVQQLHSLNSSNLSNASRLLSQAKISLLKLDALVPSPSTSAQHLALARDVLEAGALVSIRQRDPDAFTRYFQQLQPFYSLPSSRYSSSSNSGNKSKVTGLYLLLLLSQGDYAGFHTEIERLETSQDGSANLDADPFIAYPMRLEQALMEGSYDRVWGETKGNRVPGEEFGVFTEVLINTIRAEIASCSERAYPSLPISNAKNLLFLDSEGAVVDFARSRGWTARDGRIYFPAVETEAAAADGKNVMAATGLVIENTLGYARKLETIV
ncbi:hypothetical protein K461DRAFT_290127 [Myriangium duriaei CBS 260.36]|uniref:PCI domain-containing protein n=1 Tax=Myriangium duriaei CBS 260.36 TaxID=1168546 RepID=A0A9P4JA92_9PEZI|nr:hypothetical protein K461DRAFT_290127 [Myriangium duriaei CBS 260.36]